MPGARPSPRFGHGVILTPSVDQRCVKRPNWGLNTNRSRTMQFTSLERPQRKLQRITDPPLCAPAVAGQP